jgi:hypothetical protein
MELARISRETPALYMALKDELRIRREIAGLGVCGIVQDDTTIRTRLERVTSRSALLAEWKKSIGAIERVSPTPYDSGPSAA